MNGIFNRPNWYNADQYSAEYFTSVSIQPTPGYSHEVPILSRYAWEFLRRNSTYQQTFTDLYFMAKLADDSLSNAAGAGYCRNDGIQLVHGLAHDEKTDNELTKACGKFRLLEFIPRPDIDGFWFFIVDDEMVVMDSEVMERLRVKPEHYYRPTIDLTLNIEDQLRDIKKCCQEKQCRVMNIQKPIHGKKGKRHPEALSKYLRILDAEMNSPSATIIEIIENLPIKKARYSQAIGNRDSKGKGSHSPAHKEYYDLRKEAHYLRDIGWRFLLD